MPLHRRHFAILGYICGFNGGNRSLYKMIERIWKGKRNYLIIKGIKNLISWVKQGRHVCNGLNAEMYKKEKPE